MHKPITDQAVHLYLANLLPDLENAVVLGTYELFDFWKGLSRKSQEDLVSYRIL